MADIRVGDRITCVRQAGPESPDGEILMVQFYGTVLEVHKVDERGNPADDGRVDWYWVRKDVTHEELCVSAMEAVLQLNERTEDS
ncbi:hypothetical protein AB0L57_32220 [Nocardia sp. NPDC052254]|uniref:hypothetical protein n=1 Tax=Nocardia sp. NPDC052254 TaxID=3155681 RepID=UPI003448E516